MTQKEKVDLLYARAMGKLDKLPKELSKYKIYDINKNDRYLVKKSSIEQYIKAVDNDKCKQCYFDWCMENSKGDRRFKKGSKEAMKYTNQDHQISAFFAGAVFSGMAVNAILPMLNGWWCWLLGGLYALVVCKFYRRRVGLFCVVIPLFIAAIKQAILYW